MVLVCEMYFHTLCQINEDTTQCKIVVTKEKKFSRFPSSVKAPLLLGNVSLYNCANIFHAAAPNRLPKTKSIQLTLHTV